MTYDSLNRHYHCYHIGGHEAIAHVLECCATLNDAVHVTLLGSAFPKLLRVFIDETSEIELPDNCLCNTSGIFIFAQQL